MIQLGDICPVCGMAALAEVTSVKYHKMNFYFCSEQCRETFIAHPKIYSAKVGRKRSEIVKRRTMRLAEPLDREVTDLLVPYLEEMMGVKSVVVNGDKIDITYDLLQVTEIKIEKALVEIGLQLGGDWLERLCRSWVHDSEETKLENLEAASAPCCNQPPPGT